MKTKERRICPRAGISFPVECCGVSGGKYFCTVTKDMSLSGVRVASESFLPKDSVLKLSINMITGMVNAKARVIWCSKNRACERYTAGLNFIELPQVDRGQLVRFMCKISPS